MQRRQLLLIVSFITCGVLHHECVADTPWHGSLAAAQRIAKQEQKPMFIVFRCER